VIQYFSMVCARGRRGPVVGQFEFANVERHERLQTVNGRRCATKLASERHTLRAIGDAYDAEKRKKRKTHRVSDRYDGFAKKSQPT
jgi:hypothetical protein